MKKRRLERVAVMLLSIAMLLSSTGIMSSLAANAGESSSASSSAASKTETSTSVAQEGGAVAKTNVAQEGGSLVADTNGEGTAANPYKISSAAEFLKMNEKVNITTSANKYFILTSDIDLSGVSADDFAKNGGSLVSVNKSLAEKSSNAFFILDGNGHKLKGLNVTSKSGSALSIFGYANAKSVIKNLKVEKAQIKSTSESLANIAVLVSENKGTIKNVEILYSVISASKCKYAGIVAAVNSGTISDVTVRGSHSSSSTTTADSYTISAAGYAGGIAGSNRGTITAVSALNIGLFIPASDDVNTRYGGIAGYSDGTVSNSVSTGNVHGGTASDAAGGIVGLAGDGLKLTNNYTFVAISSAISGCGVIGVSGTSEMLSDCYWSYSVSGKAVPVSSGEASLNTVSTNTFKVVQVGKTAQITEADTKSTKWGKAVFSIDGAFKVKGEGLSLNDSASVVNVKGTKSDSVGVVTYQANVVLPATVGAGSGSVSIKQYMHVYVFTVPNGTVGSGTKESPLVITNNAEFAFYNYAQDLNCKLGKDISVSNPAGVLRGTLDGCGHKISAKSKLFYNVCGTVKNVDVIVTADFSDSVFGNLVDTSMSGVDVSLKDGVKFNAKSSNTGIFANTIYGKCTIDDCRVKGNIVVENEKVSTIGGFAAILNGKDTNITNSGAAVDISVNGEKKSAKTANFIGEIIGEEIKIENCYAAGTNTAGNYMLVSAISKKSVSFKNIYIDYSDNKNAAKLPLSFDAYKDFVSESQFREWTFEAGVSGFFTGNSGKFSSALPAIKSIENSKASDFRLVYDASKVAASVTVEGGKLLLNASRAGGVVTVKAVPVQVISTKTGLSETIYVSNGLEKDANGNWIIATPYDLAYVGENIEELSKSSFVMSSDVDMSVIKNYSPIGSTAAAFSGSFDGKGHTISNLTISGTAKTALFGTLSDAAVKNIKIVNAAVNSQGGYAAVLAGQALGKTVISGITVENSKVNVDSNYAAVIVASVDNASAVKISDIAVKNSEIKSTAGYVGAAAGKITENTTVSDVTVDKFTAHGANFVSGIVGLAQGSKAVSLNNVKVNASVISGVSEVSGITSGEGKGISLKDAEVKASKISTVSAESSFIAGGIAAVYASSMENVLVDSSEIKAGVAGGIVGKTSADCALVIKNAEIKASAISASEANSVAGGILAVHNSNGFAEIIGGKVDADTVISGAAVTSAIVGDCSGANSILSINGTKTFACVKGNETSNAVSAAGALGRIGAAAVSNVSIKNVKIGGTVSGAGILGGIVGFVKNGEAYNEKAAIISDTVAYAQLISFDAQTQCGMIIGGLEGRKVLESKSLDKAITNTIISTYFGSVSAYSEQSRLEGGNYVDMDKPNGSAITSSVPVLTTTKETEVTINNLPSVNGYKFDSKTGWISESDDRITVVSCSGNKAVLKANHMADISIVGYYVLSADEEIRVPVHFRMISDIRTPLKGEGTKDSPYLVTCAYDLETVAQYSSEKAYFALTNDIVFKPDDFEFGGAFYNVGNGVVTIGDATSGFKGTFTGLYNGKVHSITGLAVSGNTFGALFGSTDGAVITDLVINNADISGLTYAAVVVGSAKNTTIRNITINSAKVEAIDFGGYVGSVVGYAENTVIENITVNGADIKTVLDATDATVEVAGGIAGVFDGTVKTVNMNDVTVSSDTVAGGVIGSAGKDSVAVSDVSVSADINAEIAGGVIGKTENPLKGSISNCAVMGNVNGTDVSAGIIGKIDTENSSLSVDKLDNPLISNTVVTAKVKNSELCGIAVGSASTAVICNKENTKTDVFKGIYYSFYQNRMGVFGTEEINSYQKSEYSATDLSKLSYVAGGEAKDYIPMSANTLTLADNSIKINGVNGSFKAFTVGGKKFELQTIKSEKDGELTYDKAASSLVLNTASDADSKAVLAYNDGLELAIDIIQAEALRGKGTAQSPYEIADAADFELLLQNAAEKDVYYTLKADINISSVGSAELFAGILYGNGYVLYDFTGASLFGRVTGTISDTGFIGFKIEDNSSEAVGAVAEVIDGGIIKNCVVIADVYANGNNQDAGIVAGRAVNGAEISDTVTSGRVIGKSALAVGGVVGILNNSKLIKVDSTAYVSGGRFAGGMAGEAQLAKINRTIFANMVETADGKAGNVVGANDGSTINYAFFDKNTARSENAAGEGEVTKYAYPTAELARVGIDGFKASDGYPVPSALLKITNSKFAAGVAFAAMKVNYLAGLNAGTVYNYTSVSVEPTVNGNDVALETGSGLKIKLVPSADFADCKNEIARYSNPARSNGVNVSCNIVDGTKGLLSDKLIGVLLKSKVGENSQSFDFFTKANTEAKVISAVVVTDGALYVDAELPQGVKFSVSAVNENGSELTVTDAKNEGKLISTGSSKSVVITITAENSDEETWGLRSVWGVIGK